MESIFEEIRKERQQQLDKWGIVNHTPIEWLAILMEEVGEVSKEVLESHFINYYDYDPERISRCKKELIQVTTVCVDMLESLDKKLKFLKS